MPMTTHSQHGDAAPTSIPGTDERFDDLGVAVSTEEPLARHTWLGVGGSARFFCEPVDVEALSKVVRRCHDLGIPLRVIGGGSNVLVSSSGFDGMVVRLTGPEFCEIRVDRPSLVAGAGAKLVHAVTAAVQAGLSGLETLVGIPGTVGGGLVGNAGGRGGDISQRVREVTVLNHQGEVEVRQGNDLSFESRWSNLDDAIIISCRLELEEESAESLTKRMQKQWILERAYQPAGTRSVAMMFKDPQGSTAESLISQSGAKDQSVGKASVVSSHANFIATKPDCTSDDVRSLLEQVRSHVRERLGVDLKPQIEVW
jgi:UDP-N-acetylmuramate dehydrogenase